MNWRELWPPRWVKRRVEDAATGRFDSSRFKSRKQELRYARKYHEQSVLVLTFLGAVAFTGLVLMLTEKTEIENATRWFGINSSLYFQFVTFWLGLTSAICVMTAYEVQRMVARWADFGTLANWLASSGYILCGMMFLASLPLSIFPFAPDAGILLFVFGLIIGIVFLFAPNRRAVLTPSKPKPSGSTTLQELPRTTTTPKEGDRKQEPPS